MRRRSGSPGSRPPSKTTCSRTRAGSHLPSPSCLRSGHSNPGRWNHLPINDAGEWGRFLRTVERQLAQRSQPFLSPLSRGPCSSSTTMMRCVPSSVSTSASKAFTDNGPQYTATATVLYAHELGLVPITTPAYSPESNGLAEAFVGTFKRDYVNGAELRDAEAVLAQLGQWLEDYNRQAPHSALGMRPSVEYRATLEL